MRQTPNSKPTEMQSKKSQPPTFEDQLERVQHLSSLTGHSPTRVGSLVRCFHNIAGFKIEIS